MKEIHQLHRLSYRTGFLSQKIQWVLTTKTSWTLRVRVWLPGDHNDSILKLRALSLLLSLFLFLSHRITPTTKWKQESITKVIAKLVGVNILWILSSNNWFFFSVHSLSLSTPRTTFRDLGGEKTFSHATIEGEKTRKSSTGSSLPLHPYNSNLTHAQICHLFGCKRTCLAFVIFFSLCFTTDQPSAFAENI